MTDYLVLTEFIPGTKAKAQEINANFSAVKDAINAKAPFDGNSTQTFSVADATEKNQAVSKSQLDTLSEDVTKKINGTSSRFCAKCGNVTNGMADLFGFSNLTVTPKIGGSYSNLTISNYKGEFTTLSTVTPINMAGKPDGVYNIFAKSDETLYAVANKIYKQPIRPTILSGDVWLNTSVEPLNAIKYEGSKDVEFLDVPVGAVTLANGVITKTETFPYNQNGYNVTSQSNDWAKAFPDYSKGVSKSTATQQAECDGFLSIWGSDSYSYDVRIFVGSTASNVNTMVYFVYWDISAVGGTTYESALIPISKGTWYRIQGFENGTTATFYPAKGVN